MQREKPPFLWGVATSSHQIEGNNQRNDWWAWEQAGNIEGGVRSGLATDHWNRFKEDIRLAADLGVNSYRFSLEWSRLQPSQSGFDTEATEWYRDLIAECERYKLLPMVTLHHFTSPQWFAELGGFPSRDAPKLFKRYVEYVADKIGDHVPLWCTLNEPMVMIAGGYLARFMPPGQFAPAKASRACANLLRIHVDAYDLLHSKIKIRRGPWKDLPLQVGLAHNMLDFHPERSWHPLDRYLSAICNRFYNQAWLDAVTGKKQHFGVWGIVPYAKQVKRALDRVTVDFIGLNYYTKAYMRWHPPYPERRFHPMLPIGMHHAHRTEPQSDMNWAIHPRGFRRMLRRVARYGLPTIVTENGIADSEDRYRADFIQTHIAELDKVLAEGLDIRGYYHWSLMDNFEWVRGFGPRFGLYQVDYETMERIPRPSAKAYRKLIRNRRAQPHPSKASGIKSQGVGEDP